MKVFCFTWNTQSVRICESLDDSVIKMNRENDKSIMSYFTKYCSNCMKADFLPVLIEMILDQDADIVCVSFQEDAYPGSYFHSDLLKNHMSSNGYTLLKRGKLIGIGKTTLQAMMNGELVARGLRTSIYAKNQLANEIKQFEQSLFKKAIPDYEQKEFTNSMYRNKGAICIDVYHPHHGKLTFINCHFPFFPERLKNYSENRDDIYLQEKLHEQNKFYNEIYREFVQKNSASCIFWMGDFNYRVQIIPKPEETLTISDLKFKIDVTYPQENQTEIWKEMYNNHDELLNQIKKGIIYPMNEGIDNQGPIFAPTCKLEKSETRGYKMGKNKQRYPSWCDRILYKGNVKCIAYKSWDYGTLMKRSDHASVIGVFQILPDDWE